MWEKFSNREKIMLAGLLAGAVIFSFCYFILAPQVKAYVQAKSELADCLEKLSQAQVVAASLKDESDKLNRAIEEFGSKGRLFASKISDGSDLIVLGLQSAHENVEITGIEPGGIKENQYSLELPLKVDMMGDYRDVQEFCKNIDKNMDYLINLTELISIKIEQAGSSPWDMASGVAVSPGTVKVALGMVMYSAKNPGERALLEEVSKWLTGRYDIFKPASVIPPIPELAGHLKMPEESELGELNPGPSSEGVESRASNHRTQVNNSSAGLEPEYITKK